MPKLSIIIPVYNAEKFLKRCIDSIFSQQFSDFELILLNDGSTDNSGCICDEYAKKDSRVRVFHQQNSGASSARNNGISHAVGNYIMFADADDMLKEGTLEHNMSYLFSHDDVDILRFPMYSRNTEGICTEFSKIKEANTLIGNQSVFSEWCSNMNVISRFVSGKIYKRSLISKIDFPTNLRFCEDMLWLSKILNHCEKLYFSDMGGYFWCQDNSDSVCHKNETMCNYLDPLEADLTLLCLACKREDFLHETLTVYGLSIMELIAGYIKAPNSERKCFNKYISAFAEFSFPIRAILRHTKKNKNKIKFLCIKLFGLKIFCQIVAWAYYIKKKNNFY